ncbi:MAG: transporter substrate-binding domain-containing protein, partial [Arcobacteraceae bacterium]
TKTWSQTIQYSKERKCDIISLAMETLSRKEYLNFTSPYLKIPIVIATKHDVPFINHVDDIKYSKKIGITKDYAFVEILKDKYPNLNIVEVEDIEEGLLKVNKGELFGFIGTLASISHQFQLGSRGELKIAGKLGENWELGIAVRNDDKILFNILEHVVQSIDSHKQQQILNNWVSIKYEDRIDYTLIWQILIFMAILLSLFIYKQYSLNRSNTILQRAVEEKTQDLQKLNDNLELKIQEEVAKNNLIQQKLFKSEKMASMGEMIGNIAHQWRQPLSIISTASTGIIMEKEYGVLDDEKLIKTCTTINNNAQYLSKTIDDFKNFIKGDRIKSAFSLKENIMSFLNLVEGSVKNHEIVIVQDIKQDIKINGYENELTQCFINIFNNSKDALIENVQTPQIRYFFIIAYIEEDKVVIKLRDNGKGIPVALLHKIFDPYFTTKHKSLGTGLGLHMTYNLIVDGMTGTIEAKTLDFEYDGKSYTGAEFTISLPIK